MGDHIRSIDDIVDQEGNVTDQTFRNKIVQGVTAYIKHLEQNKEHSSPILHFMNSYDPNRGRVIQRPENGGACYYGHFRKIHEWFSLITTLPEEMDFPEWIRAQIPIGLREKLDRLVAIYFKEYTIEQGVQIYLDYVKEHDEAMPSLNTFFRTYDTEARELRRHTRPGVKEKNKRLNRFYVCFSKIQKEGQYANFDEWVIEKLPEKMRDELNALTAEYQKEYTVRQGAEMFIKYLRQNRWDSSPMQQFFKYCDIRSKPLALRESNRSLQNNGGLNRHVNRFYKISAGEKDELSFEDWVKQQILKRLGNTIDRLSAKYLVECDIATGVQLFIDYLKANGEDSRPLVTFFVDIDRRGDLRAFGQRYLEKGQRARLHRHYIRFSTDEGSARKASFEDYLLFHLPEEKRGEAAYYLKGQYLEDMRKARVDPERLKGALLGE